MIFNRPGVAKAVLLSLSLLIDLVTDSWFVTISLRRRHAPMVENGALSHKIDYITIFEEILNLKGHQNCTTGSRVTVILLNAWIFPIGQTGGASPWRVYYQRGLPRLVFPNVKDLKQLLLLLLE